MHDKRAVSAVIATVIIVAVTIAIAIAVAYWMGGLATIFTRFEKLEVSSAYVVQDAITKDYVITLHYVNTGATATSIDMISLNGVPLNVVPTQWTPVPTLGIDFGTLPSPCPTGVAKSGTITFAPKTADLSGNQLNAGVTVTITIHTTGGKDYHASVTLS
jgi:hypothetical protein